MGKKEPGGGRCWRRRSALSAAALAVHFLAAGAAAATLNWDPNLAQPGAQGGTGLWDTTATNWWSSALGTNVIWNSGHPDAATFGGLAGTVTVRADLAATLLQFDTPGYTFYQGTYTVTVNGSLINSAGATFVDSAVDPAVPSGLHLGLMDSPIDATFKVIAEQHAPMLRVEAAAATFGGVWRGGDFVSTRSYVLLSSGGKFVAGPGARIDAIAKTTVGGATYLTSPCPFVVQGAAGGSEEYLDFDVAFNADLGTAAAPAGGLSNLTLSNLTWITRASQSLPSIYRHLPAYTLVHTGSITIDTPGAVTWQVRTSDQAYAGAVHWKGSWTLDIDAGHTLTLNPDPAALAAGADVAFGSATTTNTTLLKTGAGTLAVAGPQSHATGSVLRLYGGAMTMSTDPGRGPGPDGLYNTSDDVFTRTLALTVGHPSDTTKAATATLAASAHLAGLAVNPSSTAALTSGGGKVLVTSTLSLSSQSKLDLRDNDLIVQVPAGQSAAAAYDLLLSAVEAGAHGGRWDSPTGLTSSTAAASGLLYGLAFIRWSDLSAAAGTFDGEPVDSQSLLAKYTLMGDANLDGLVEAADYAILDAAYAHNHPADGSVPTTLLGGWLHGDFNYDGRIDGQDYQFIDHAYHVTHPLAATTPSSLPEPSSLGLLVLGATPLLRRANRRHPPESGCQGSVY